MNVTADSLEKKFKGEGLERFKQIAELGGFGMVADAGGNIPPTFAGGLDLVGVLAEDNHALTASQKTKLRDLAGVDAPADASKAKTADKEIK